ncbi:MAG: Fe-S cluster assembly protein SufD, partial [Anaerolineales bacterium]
TIPFSKKMHPGKLEDFSFDETLIPRLNDDRINQYHHSAWNHYINLPFPDPKDEAWRRTDIRNLQTSKFILSVGSDGYERPPAQLLSPLISGKKRSGEIVSGAIETIAIIDEDLEEKGVIFKDFHRAELEHPDLLARLLGEIVSPDEDKFTALAAALGSDGVFLYVPKDVVIEQPLHSLYWGAGKNKAFINHLIIWLEEGSAVTFVHENASPHNQSDPQLLHNGIVEIHVGKRAKFNFVELQSWGQNVWSFTRERAHVMAGGTLEWIFGAMGTHLTKNFSDINLLEGGAKTRVSGFYFTDGNQHLDLDTQQNHLAKNTISDLLYKGALVDQSHTVWQGMVYVAPGAFGTDGYQANRNLILSKGAHADSIPGLEILADDVQCSHGATVGKIDENELFYLLSRGIPMKEAKQLIVMGFFTPILERIPFEGVRDRFIAAIREKMG